MRSSEVQEFLNTLRQVRQPALTVIPVTGKMDKKTRDALRAFQHEHNAFNGNRLLSESGRMNATTRKAIEWWRLILRTPKEGEADER